jgi:hypothetical protein
MGQLQRGQVAPAGREHLCACLARLTGHGDVAFALEGCITWRYVAEELAAAGIAVHLGEPAGIAATPAAASGTPRRTGATGGTCGNCWPRAGCRSAGSRPAASRSAGRCWSTEPVTRRLETQRCAIKRTSPELSG